MPATVLQLVPATSIDHGVRTLGLRVVRRKDLLIFVLSHLGRRHSVFIATGTHLQGLPGHVSHMCDVVGLEERPLAAAFRVGYVVDDGARLGVRPSDLHRLQRDRQPIPQHARRAEPDRQFVRIKRCTPSQTRPVVHRRHLLRHRGKPQLHLDRALQHGFVSSLQIPEAQLEATLAAFRTYLQVRFEVAPKTATVEGLQRKEIWEYPLDALREAVINALIHRDYTALGEIQVRVREDSIEVWNPGGLPEGVRLEDLRREGHTSRPRNPSLAQVFFYAGLVERWGSGTTNMIRACREQDLPEPEFSEHTGGFAVTFSKDMYTSESLKRRGLNERQIRAVGETKQSGTITNERYTKLVGVSKATATRDLEELVGLGILERHGRTGRGTRYELKGSKTAQTAHERLKKGSADSGRGKHR